MVTKDDLVGTVVAAYSAGWRQVKLYFMCGLPTETDEDVLEIAEMAKDVIRAGRAATGTRDIRCTVSSAGSCPSRTRRSSGSRSSTTRRPTAG